MIFKDKLQDLYYYSTANVAFLVLIVMLLYSLFLFSDHFVTSPILGFIVHILITGYGLEIIRDTIKGGERLPKIRPKKIIIGGMELFVITFFYTIPQNIVLEFLTHSLGFYKIFELEELFFHGLDFYQMFLANPINFLIYIVLFLIISYISIFFYEIAISSFAETDNLLNAFKLRDIWGKIRIIGVRNYMMGYTKLILLISIFLFIVEFLNDVAPLSASLVSIIVFLLQYRSMGLVYKEYILD